MPNSNGWKLALAAYGAASLVACSSAMRTSADAYVPSPTALAAARTAIEPQFREMFIAANAHDTDRHLAAYRRSPSLTFVANDQVIHGWDALRVQQLRWWQNGKSDAVYAVIGTPEYTMPSPDVVVQTYLLDSHRAGSDGATRGAHISVTDVWQRGADGWRIVYAHESVVPQ